jgi:hypothetical protein
VRLLALAFTIVGFALRVPLLSRALWSAEGSTYNVIDVGSFGAVLDRVWATELTPPFYYLLEYLWTRIAGTSEIALRVPSLLFSVGTIPVMFALGRRVAGLTGAVVCAACAALSPLAIEMGAEARAYALATFFAAVFLYAFAALLTEPRRPLVLQATVAISGSLLVVTFATGLVIAGIVAIWAIARAAIRRDRMSAATAGFALVPCACALITLPFMMHFESIWHGCCAQNPGLSTRIDDHLNSLSIFGVMQSQLNTLIEIGVAVWLIGLPFRRRDRLDELTGATLAIVVVGIALSIAKDLPVGRHLLVYAPAYWLMLGMLSARFADWLRRPGRLRWLVLAPVAYVLVGALISYHRAYDAISRPVSGVRDAVTALAPFRRSSLLVIAAPDYLGPTLNYYLPADSSIVLRGITTWEAPQFYPFHAQPWYVPHFAEVEAERVERLARLRHALVAVFADPHPLDYNGVPFSRVQGVVARLRQDNDVIFERVYPGTRESVDLMVLR